MKELQAWSKSVRDLQKCMAAIHAKLDMEDRRKSI